jgi:WD40 repeat protein
LAALPGHSACVNTVVFSPDGKQLATGTADGMLRVWDVGKRAELSATNLRSGVRSIAFLADDETLALGQWPGRVFLWDLPTRQRGQAFAGHEKADAMVDHIAISPDGSLLASTGTDGMIYLWPVPEFGADGKRSLRPKPSSGKMASADLVRKWKSNSRDNAPAGKDGRKD